jgi:hypothetical protein
MPLFKCPECGCVENTAVSNYWIQKLYDQPVRCSLCDPEIRKWHGLFPRKQASGYKLGSDGFLYEPELLAKGDFDGMLKRGLKIIGDA